MQNTENQLVTVGQSVLRPDALDKVRGRAKYIADLNRPGMLHAVTVRSSVACMQNISIDSSVAESMPGVVKVVTAADIPGSKQVPLIFTDQPFLAQNEIKFHGEAVVLVVVETREQARTAADTVKISGEIRDPVLRTEDALTNEAPVIYSPTSNSTEEKNIFKKYHIQRGNLHTEMQKSDVVIERVYSTPHQEHAYLETQGAFAEPMDNNCIQVSGSMQCPFYVQDAIAAILDFPRARITVIQTTTGGAFGGKEDVPSIVAGHAALLTHLTDRPVSLIYNREEDFRAMSKRHPSIVHLKIGCRSDGIVTAAEILVTLNGGAYATLSPIVLWRSAIHAAGPYKWLAVTINARAVATNTVPNGAFRGFGEPQVVFAIESAMDELAAILNIDPLTFRLKNVLNHPSDITATGQPIVQPGLKEALIKASEEIDWKQKYKTRPKTIPSIKADPVRGVGISVSFYGVGLGAGGKKLARAGAYVQVELDASIRVFIGNTEMGQGARSVIGQIAAESLAAPFENVHVSKVDTSRVPDSGPTVASRTTIMSGGAVMEACRTIRASLITAVADELGCPESDIITENLSFRRKNTAEAGIPFARAVDLATQRRLQLASSGWFVSPFTSFAEETNGQGHAYMTYVWSCNAVEVEVDPGTLRVKIIKLAAAHDVGKAINPREVSGQIQGGSLQGLGYALSETIAYSGLTPVIGTLPDGIMLNPGFSGYICPTAMDAPKIIPIIIENAYDEGPYGARGIGEPPLIAVAPAVANAVANAMGLRVQNLPVSPEHILDVLNKVRTSHE
ncbi:xanthine dehydrogenase family protein molybdopterin-binding subunit [bacterium]|nr:xanthine dehydrogenase family protein molybdopterin-binding subunit [bacterium]